MNNNTVSLEPRIVFDCFAEINKVPRPSKKEEKIVAYIKKFGEELHLETLVDHVGNIVIRKPATPGKEHLPMVILQSHVDMVCEKIAGSDFNFETDSIETYVDGDWLKAKGTTLGADDGIGVAIQMAILKSTDIEHGPLECVFTIDEETGLTGAMEMEAGFMTGKYLINLDSEDEGQIFISCAGGAGTEAEYPFVEEEAPADSYFFKIQFKGLTGGHSGDNIKDRRANANKLLLRFLEVQMKLHDVRIADIQSGGLHNAIPRDGYAICCAPLEYEEQIEKDLQVLLSELREEFSQTEPNLEATIEKVESSGVVMEQEKALRMVKSLRVLHNGVFEMDQDMEGFVQTSSNLASIRKQGNIVKVITSQRSSLLSARKNMSALVRDAFELGGATCKTADGYPGWKLNPNSPLLKTAVESYKRVFGKAPQVLGIHAGLECGLLSEKYPDIDMVSFGPTLRGVHSPDERLLIPTVQMVWDHLLDLLLHIGQD